jgi:ABC-type nitrate/sulfonate/bicarbonate transport system permease component
VKALKKINLVGLVTFGAALLLWEVSSRSSPAIQFYFPPVSRVVLSLIELIQSWRLVEHLSASLGRFLTGYLLAAVIAVAAGIFLGYFRVAYSFAQVVIELLRPMPSVALIPVAILFLGIGDSMIVSVTVYACAWPILINTIDGVRNIDRTLIDTGRTLGLSPSQILRKIALPAASPYILTGLRISLPIALILVTTAEMVVGGKGLGFFILDEERSLRAGNMYAGIVLVAALGYCLNRLFVALERKVLVWHRGMRATEVI